MVDKRKVVAGLLVCCAIVLVTLWVHAELWGVPILAYHEVADEVAGEDEANLYSVSPDQFEQQLIYLKNSGYHSVSLHEVYEAWQGRAVLPSKPIVITFDDGYEDNYTQALPLLEKYGFSSTVFIIVNKIGENDYLSWDEVRAMQAQHTEIGSHTLNHVSLGETASPDKQQEIVESKRLIEGEIHRPVEFLAYPYGSYDPECFALLAEAGYLGACTGKTGYNLSGDGQPYGLKRVNIPRPRLGLWEFKLRLWKSLLLSPFT